MSNAYIVTRDGKLKRDPTGVLSHGCVPGWFRLDPISRDQDGEIIPICPRCGESFSDQLEWIDSMNAKVEVLEYFPDGESEESPYTSEEREESEYWRSEVNFAHEILNRAGIGKEHWSLAGRIELLLERSGMNNE